MHEGVTEDLLLNGQVRVRQPAQGFRAGIDSVLLAAAVEADAGMSLMEAGCGAGAALVCAAHLSPLARFVGIERQADLAALAQENVVLNGYADRVTIEAGDVLAMSGASFDGVFVNPPYDDAATSPPPDLSRAASYLTADSIDVWVRRLADRLKGGAAFTMIHRAARLTEILAAFEGRVGDVEVLPIRPRADAPAKRILVRGRKGSRAPLSLLRGLDLHDESGAKYTPEAEAILRGAGPLIWR